MNDKKCKEIFFNRAQAEGAERIHCENCFETVVFLMKDKEHKFSVGLMTVLECLEYAVKSGDLPKLPQSWCSDVEAAFNIAFDEGVSYYDYETFEKRKKLR